MLSLLLGNDIFYISETLIPKSRLEALQFFRQYGTIYPTITTEVKEFGIMNYAFSLPVSISTKKINALITYSYNIPKALSSETLTFSESSFIMASFSYTLTFEKQRQH